MTAIRPPEQLTSQSDRDSAPEAHTCRPQIGIMKATRNFYLMQGSMVSVAYFNNLAIREIFPPSSFQLVNAYLRVFQFDS